MPLQFVFSALLHSIFHSFITRFHAFSVLLNPRHECTVDFERMAAIDSECQRLLSPTQGFPPYLVIGT